MLQAVKLDAVTPLVGEIWTYEVALDVPMKILAFDLE